MRSDETTKASGISNRNNGRSGKSSSRSNNNNNYSENNIPTRKGSSSSKMLAMAETVNAFKLFAYNMDLKCNSATNTQKMCVCVHTVYTQRREEL